MSNQFYSPRIVGERRADVSGLENLLASPPFAGRQGESLALALYDYLTSPVDGVWHGWPPNERAGEPVGWGDVSDPVKTLNVYGWAICGQSAELLHGLYRAAGLPARIRGLPGHNVCEVFYDGRWHLLDADMRSWFRAPDGHIVDVDELTQNARALIVENTNKSNPCNLPDRSLDDYAKMYEQARKEGASIFPHWATRAHTMDFMLRPGETLIRSQVHEGRFHLPKTWRELLRGSAGHEWQGLPRERFAPFRTIGNGRWTYAPDLTDRSRDFELGVWHREGLAQDARGLRGPGTAIFRIQSPYPFCGLPDATHPDVPPSNGVWLSLSGKGAVSAEVTDSEGRYVTVAATNGTFALKPDVTPLLDARYGALIRLTLAAGSQLETFALDGFLMTAPLSLPRLAEGRNRMELRSGDKFGKHTVPWTVPVDFRSEAALRQTLVRLEAGALQAWKRDRLRIAPAAAGPAQAIFRFDAPESGRFAWAYAIATVPEGPTNTPPRQAEMALSMDGVSWTNVARVAIPATPLQWDASLDGEIVPSAAAPALWLRVTSDTGIIALEFAGHLEAPPSTGDLRITHRWTEDGVPREFTAPPGQAGYEIMCGRNPQAHTIEMRAPASKRSGQ
ncbi:MAG: hypothetical protein WCI17_08345 [bacterium]